MDSKFPEIKVFISNSRHSQEFVSTKAPFQAAFKKPSSIPCLDLMVFDKDKEKSPL